MCFEQLASGYLSLGQRRNRPSSDDHDLGYVRLESFFQAMQGFLSGELDLDTFSFNPYGNNLEKIEPHVEAQLHHYIDDAGRPRSRTTHVIHRRLWKDFESKWLVPENGYVFVEARVGGQGPTLSVIYEMMRL